MHDSIQHELGRVIRAERVRRRMTQLDLIAKSGLGRSTVRRIESGERDMSVSQLLAIAAALDVSPVAILADALHE